MSIAYTKVPGLDEVRLVALIEPVLLACGVSGVELLWKTDASGWVLSLSVEKLAPLSSAAGLASGEGISIDLCSELSRELSNVLDEADLIPRAYRLEIGSAGMERSLYSRDDFLRFEGRLAKIKATQPGQDAQVVCGKILGLDEAGNVQLETETGRVAVSYDTIATARLVFDWNSPNVLGGAKAKSPKPRSSERDRRNRASKRKR
jgi:ribosome maturation factor RimP